MGLVPVNLVKKSVYIKPSKKPNKIATNSPDLQALDIVLILFENTRCSATRCSAGPTGRPQDVVPDTRCSIDPT